MVAYWSEMWWFIVRRCGGSLVGNVVAHCLEKWSFIDRRCSGFLFGDVVFHSGDDMAY